MVKSARRIEEAKQRMGTSKSWCAESEKEFTTKSGKVLEEGESLPPTDAETRDTGDAHKLTLAVANE
jgi:hypothetical protein